MKYTVFLFVLLITCICVSTAFGGSLYVKKISEDLQEVVLGEVNTPMQWRAEKGDKVEGWTVIDITKDKVVIRCEPDRETLTATQIELSVPEFSKIKKSPRGK